ncbi:MAG: right-handed parallel beta-helix repeat-containing protein [Mycobacterium sp.]
MKTPGQQFDALIGDVAKLHGQQAALAQTLIERANEQDVAIHNLAAKVARLEGRIPPPAPNPSPLPSPVPEPTPEPPSTGWLARQPDSNAIECNKGDDCEKRLGQAQADRRHISFERSAIFHDRLGTLYRSGTVMGTHGDGPRPVFTSHEDVLYIPPAKTVNDIAISGLHFHALERDPRHERFRKSSVPYPSSAITWNGSGQNIVIEDCISELYAYGMRFDSPRPRLIDGLTLSRNIIRYCWNTGHGNRAGIITGWVKDLLIEENVFDHNGHLPAEWGVSGTTPDDQSHALYLAPLPEESGPRTGFEATVRGNLFARSGSHGIKGGPGGVLEDNLFVGNAIAGYMSRSDSEILGNVVIEARDISDDHPRGWGIEAFGMGQATFEGNVYANPAVISDDKRRDFHSSAGRTVASGNHVYAETAGSVEMEGTSYHRRRLDHGVDLDRLITDESSRGHGQWTGDIAAAVRQVQEAAR